MQWLALLTLTSLAVLLEVLGRHVILAGSGSLRVRGVPQSKGPLYSSDQDFQCLDGSLTITFDKVNDDYCDCPDGSDEPGTAACGNGAFYCQNFGHQPAYIPSSWVNDGVCDCCDTSDEYSSGAQCTDNCHQLGQQAMIEAQKAAELARAGNQIRLDYSKKGKQLKTEFQSKLSKLRADFEEAERTKKEREVVKKTAEDRESAALEKYKPPEPEPQPDANVQEEEKKLAQEEAQEYFKLLDSDGSGTVSIAELQTRVTFDKNKNGEVSREEALYFLNNMEELTMQEFVEKAWGNVKPFLMLEKGLFKPAGEQPETEEAHSEDLEPEHELEDEEHPEDDHHEEDHPEDEESEVPEVDGHPGEVEEQTQDEATPDPPQPQYDEETQALIDEAKEAREKFQEAERAVHDLLTEIRQTEEKLERDYGPEEEFASLEGQCFEYTDHEYVYSFCPFGRVTQRSKSGGSDVNLGQWNEWIGPGGNKYSKAKYDRGLTCWNGPSRMTTITLKCGQRDEIVSVSEPARCEYAMEFITPALCNPSNVDSAGSVHDEL